MQDAGNAATVWSQRRPQICGIERIEMTPDQEFFAELSVQIAVAAGTLILAAGCDLG